MHVMQANISDPNVAAALANDLRSNPVGGGQVYVNLDKGLGSVVVYNVVGPVDVNPADQTTYGVESNKSKGRGVAIGSIIAGIAGGLAAGALIIALIMCYVRRKRAKHER